MFITLYHRSYPVEGAPESISFAPFPAHQRHTFTAGGAVHDAEYKELRVVAPDGATVGTERRSWDCPQGAVLNWTGKKGPVVSTAKEVFELTRTRGSGFRMAK